VKREAEHVEPRHRRHPILLQRLAGRIEDRKLDPGEVEAVASRPDDAGDAFRVEIERRADRLAVTFPPQRRPRLLRAVQSIGRDELVDDAAGEPLVGVGGTQPLPHIGREVQGTIVRPDQPAKQHHAIMREGVQAQRPSTIATGELGAKDEVAPRVAERRDPVGHLPPAVADRHPDVATEGEVDAVSGGLNLFDDLATGLSGTDDQHVAGGKLRRAPVLVRVQLDDVPRDRRREPRAKRDLMPAGRDHRVSRRQPAARRLDDEAAVAVRLQGRGAHPEAKGWMDHCGVGSEVGDDFGAGGVAVWIVARVREARQVERFAGEPVERERVPARAPGVRGRGRFEDDVIVPRLTEQITHDQTGLTAADDHGIDPFARSGRSTFVPGRASGDGGWMRWHGSHSRGLTESDRACHPVGTAVRQGTSLSGWSWNAGPGYRFVGAMPASPGRP
jgi:hypothetical protein